jgi:hypothetical protein
MSSKKPLPKKSASKKSASSSIVTPLNLAIAVLLGGCVLAFIPAAAPPRPPITTREQAEQLDKAIDSVHAARDKPAFNVEVLLAMLNRGYKVKIGGPPLIPPKAPTDKPPSADDPSPYETVHANAFRVIAFAADHHTKDLDLGPVDPQAISAVKREIFLQAHVHMLGRAGDIVWIDGSDSKGEGSVSARCEQFIRQGLTCSAWKDDKAVLDSLQAIADAPVSANTAGMAEGAYVPPASKVFLVSSSDRLSKLGLPPPSDSPYAEIRTVASDLHHLVLVSRN